MENKQNQIYVHIRFYLFYVCFPLLQMLRDFVKTLEILLCVPEMACILSRATRRKILRCIIDLPDISHRMHMHGKIFYCFVHGISMPLITNDCSISTCVTFTGVPCNHRVTKRTGRRYMTICKDYFNNS